jgi:hypothetical protein
MEETKLIKQLDLETFLSKRELVPRIRAEFEESKDCDFRGHFRDHGIPEKFGFDVLVQMVIHKRPTLATLVGILNHHCKNDLQATADMIRRCAEADLMDWHEELKVFIVKIDISPDVQAELDAFQYPLPCVVPPKFLRNNLDNGYYLRPGSVILRDNHHNKDVSLDFLNIMNHVPLALDEDTALMIKNKWRNLDKPKPGETHEEFQKRRRQFEKYDRSAKDAIALMTTLSDHFYCVWRFDKRGRSYPMGYHINPQGTAWNKAVIALHRKEIVEGV